MSQAVSNHLGREVYDMLLWRWAELAYMHARSRPQDPDASEV
jgi:hypothetical protein